MHFKQFFLFLFIFQSGCHFLNHDGLQSHQNKPPIKIYMGELACLKNLNSQINSFLSDELSAIELDHSFDCIDRSIEKFQTLTRPNISGYYSSEELRHFINRYLLGQQKVTESFMLEVMKIKSFALGGNLTHLSAQEISKGREYLQLLKVEMRKIKGFVKIASFQSILNEQDQVAKIHDMVKGLVSRMTTDIVFQGDYSLQDFFRFAKEAAHFAEHDILFKKIENYESLALGVKRLLIGSGQHTQTRHQWSHSVAWGVEVYNLALKMYWFFNHFEKEKSTTWSRLMQLGDDVFKYLEESPQFLNQKRWYTQDIDFIIDELYRLEIIKLSLSSDILKSSYKMAVIRFLNRDRMASRLSQELAAIEEPQLRFLQAEWVLWKKNQSWILNQSPLTTDNLSSKAKQELEQITSNLVKYSSPMARKNKQDFMDWLDIFANHPFYLWSDDLKLRFPGQSDSLQVTSLYGLSIFNFIRSLSRFMIMGYGLMPQHEVWNDHINNKSLQQFEQDFFDFTVSMRVIDPRTPNRAERIVQEANLFTLSGNGDSLVSGRELTELLTLMIVGGKLVTDRFYQSLFEGQANKCPIVRPNVLGKPTFSRDCVQHQLVQFLNQNLDPIAGLKLEWHQLSPAEQSLLAGDLLDIGRVSTLYRQSEAFDAEYVEFRTSLVIIYYVESLMKTYDIDKNQMLSLAEVQKAAPRFYGFLTDLLVRKLEHQFKINPKFHKYFMPKPLLLNIAFSYVVQFGKEPSASDLIKFLPSYTLGRYQPIDRVKLIKTLRVLKSSSGR